MSNKKKVIHWVREHLGFWFTYTRKHVSHSSGPEGSSLSPIEETKENTDLGIKIKFKF